MDEINDDKKQTKKEYNAKYYEQNKATLNQKACVVNECPFCLRKVIKNNMKTHQDSSICLRKTEERAKNKIRMDKLLIDIQN